MRDFGYHVGEDTEIYFSFERFLDLGNADLSRDIYLVAHVLRVGRMLYSDSVKKSSSSPSSVFKRPHGCAVLPVSEVLLSKDSPDEKEFSCKVFTTDEKDFHQLHELLIKKQSSKYSPLGGQPNYAREKTDNKRLFGFSFCRLMEAGGATVHDGPHELYMYKCEEKSRLDPSLYLQLPSSSNDSAASTTSSSIFARSSKETVWVHTLLCSTKLTQNVDLLSLLQWREHPDRIQEALGRVRRLDGEELVKFLQDVLDALFSMFSTEDGNSTSHSGLVFHVLVSIFSLLEDSKFEHFKPVMDAYISGHFAAALVYKGLLSSVQHCADWVNSTEKQEPIQKCFRSLEYIFKFIIQSRLLFARATGGQYEDSFRKDLYNVFYALHKMLGSSNDVILPTQLWSNYFNLAVTFLTQPSLQLEKFSEVESELIDKLDILISENKGDDEYRQLFNTMLLDRVQSEDPAWKDSGAAFISSVTRLLERLLDYRSVIQGDENRDKRMSCTNFYKNEINRKEMYLRYIYKLHDLHLPAENYTEAGFTMKLYADQLSWTSRSLCWEKGIPLCKELAELYELHLFDYAKLSDILRTQARFFDNILTQLRPEPEYFRVGFYGLSFPLFVRNKLFVYRGLEYERIGAFTQRLQTEFPSAHILMKNCPPDDTILNSEDIQICNVKPIPEENPLFPVGADIPEKIANFYISLWIERTTLITSSPLPGILRWFEVIERSVEEVPPVQFACETMAGLQVLESALVLHGDLAPAGVQPLHRRLKERFAQLKTGLRDLGSLQVHRGRPSLTSTSSIIKELLEGDSSPTIPRPPKPTHQRSLSKPLSFPCTPPPGGLDTL
ncbi:uncharacterized protein GBIM_16259 [Gryllus bimaculatus]|nr:uncharacterized protein GBIM_16259 [Gryllus bimaculatus]